LAALLVAKLAKARAATHAILVGRHETLHRSLQKADALAPVEQKSPAHQPLLPPARNRFGRNIELLAQVVDRQHRFADRVGCDFGRIGQVFDKQQQVVLQILARHLDHGLAGRAKPSNAIARVLVGIGTLGL
jgi:hypothetical protein